MTVGRNIESLIAAKHATFTAAVSGKAVPINPTSDRLMEAGSNTDLTACRMGANDLTRDDVPGGMRVEDMLRT